MLSLLIISITLTAYVKSCSIVYPQEGTYYISNAQLLSETEYPDSILLTIQRTNTWEPTPRLTFSDPSGGPWCKIMNVRDGSVGPVVNCDNFTSLIRPYSSPDTDPASTTVSCSDNCDGATATCTFTRYGIDKTITNIPYADSIPSLWGCGLTSTLPPFIIPVRPQPYPPPARDTLFTSFTIGLCNVYVLFSSNTVGLNFCARNIDGYIISNVSRAGNGWQWLLPNDYFADRNPSIYSSVNVLQSRLPCCLCYGWSTNTYTIETDPTGAYDQIFTLNRLTSGGNIDTVKARAIDVGLGFSESIRIFDLSAGTSQRFEPFLCDVIVNCVISPCSTSTCPYNPTATCVDDYCGGCNARWYCGNWEITNDCAHEPPSTYTCPAISPPPTSSPTAVCGDCYGLTLLTEGVNNAGNQCYRYRVSMCNNVNSIRLGLGNADIECGFDLRTAFVSLQPARLTYNIRVLGPQSQRGLEIFGLADGDAFRVCFDATVVRDRTLSGNVEFDNGVTEEVCPFSNVLPEFCPISPAANAVNDGGFIKKEPEMNIVDKVKGEEPMEMITFVWAGIVAFVISMIIVYIGYITCLRPSNEKNKKTQVYDEEIEDDAEKDMI